MYLFMSIVVAGILGYVLLIAGPLFGGVIAFGIIAGSLFRGLFLLNDIHKNMSKIVPKTDKAKEVYEKYLKEKDSNYQG